MATKTFKQLPAPFSTYEISTDGSVRKVANRTPIFPENNKVLIWLNNDEGERTKVAVFELVKLAAFTEEEISTASADLAKSINSSDNMSSKKGPKKKAAKAKPAAKKTAKKAAKKVATAKKPRVPGKPRGNNPARFFEKSRLFNVCLMHHQGKDKAAIIAKLGITNKQYADSVWYYKNRNWKAKIEIHLKDKK